jgi:hypothetical protein
MKTSKIELLKWLPEEGEYIEINWPKVHKTIGLDHTNWLLKQPKEQCQLVLERNDMYCRLVAEFYEERTLLNYHLMWAK